MATLTKRVDDLEQQADERDAELSEQWRAWVKSHVARGDEDAFFRWIVRPDQEANMPAETVRRMSEARERFGEYVEWRDVTGAGRVLFLAPFELTTRGMGARDRVWYVPARRAYHAGLRFDVLRALDRLPDGEAVRALCAWHDEHVPPALAEIEMRVQLHGLRWSAVESVLAGVSRSEFDALCERFGEPPDDDRRAVFDGPRVPVGLVQAVADEWGISAGVEIRP